MALDGELIPTVDLLHDPRGAELAQPPVQDRGTHSVAPFLKRSEVERLIVAQLKSDRRFETEAERVRAFVDSGAGSRSTYFNHAKKLGVNAKPR